MHNGLTKVAGQVSRGQTVPEKDLPDWKAFEAEVQALRLAHAEAPTRLLFRGVPDADYRLTTTLERADCQNMTLAEYYVLMTRITPAVETFTGVRWEFPQPDDPKVLKQFQNIQLFASLIETFPSVDVYRYMVYLRHHGFPSPLLDWSHSPFVAAYFAFRDLTRKPSSSKPEKRSVYVYCEFSKRPKGTVVGGPMMKAIGPYVRSHPRHFRQQSDYTICVEFDSRWRFHTHESVIGRHGDRQDVLWKLNLPSSEGPKILDLLNQYNLNAFSLFDAEEALLETMWFRECVLRKAPTGEYPI
jgi:hypothetical protein